MTDEQRPSGAKKTSRNRPEAERRPDARDRAAPGRADRTDKSGRQASGAPRPGGGHDQSGQRPRGAAAALIELDRDLMKLLVRRATLVSRIREGREHASTPAAVQAEKTVRVAWETAALAFSKDPRFIRQLFSLLQDLKVLSKEQADAHGSFHLAPSRAPVDAHLAGPPATRAAQMRIALAACLGKPLTLESLLLSGPILDTFKAFSQAGVDISCARRAFSGQARVAPGTPPALRDISLFVGDDLFTLYLVAILSAGQPGVLRLTGGSRLKSEDITPLRQLLPLFGARLAHTIPHSRSLPATVERAGDISSLVIVAPRDLPFEGLCALLLAPLVWNVPLTLNLSDLPASVATAALAEVRPLHRDCGADVETRGPRISFLPAELSLPEAPALPLDPVLSAYLLAIPAFTGGRFSLKGRWPEDMPGAQEAWRLLTWAGLALIAHGESVTASSGPEPFAAPLQLNDITPELGPLFLVLAAKAQSRARKPLALAGLAPFPLEETDIALAEDFFSRLGLDYAEESLTVHSGNAGAALEQAPAWTSPDAFWGMAYALAAFLNPGLQLANPTILNESMPSFWSIYNGLPAPADPAAAPFADDKDPGHGKEPDDDKPARRRIIAD